MSGGYFDRSTYAMREIAETIERDIAKALQPKPEKIDGDYWTISEIDGSTSFHHYMDGLKFSTYEEAESFLLSRQKLVSPKKKFVDMHLGDDEVIFQSKESFVEKAFDGKKIPVLYSICHCVYDHYPYGMEVLDLKEDTIDAMKEAYRQIRIAEIYAERVDWMMSGDDSEECFRERVKEDLAEFEKEYATKDWTYLDEDDE